MAFATLFLGAIMTVVLVASTGALMAMVLLERPDRLSPLPANATTPRRPHRSTARHRR